MKWKVLMTIKHFFFECRFAYAVWSCIHVAWSVTQTCRSSHMFGSWLSGFWEGKPLVLLGVTIICSLFWLYRNDLVFQNKYACYPLQFVYIASTYGYPQNGYFTGFYCSGMVTIDASGHNFFPPRYMSGDLVLWLIAIKVSGFSLCFYAKIKSEFYNYCIDSM
jgi:hypothetical protein